MSITDKMKPHELIQGLLNLQKSYANVYRAIVTGERLQYVIGKGKDINVKEERLREPLLEHVGHLPVIASFLHSHLEHSNEVDLGRVLTMLSIHDIGETILGDIMTYDKKDDDTEKENRVVEKILSSDLLPFFHEYEARESFDAKFAKSVDAMAPFLHEISSSKLTLARFKAYGFGSKNIEAKKRSLFDWDKTLKDMFEEFFIAFKNIESGRPSGFTGTADLS